MGKTSKAETSTQGAESAKQKDFKKFFADRKLMEEAVSKVETLEVGEEMTGYFRAFTEDDMKFKGSCKVTLADEDTGEEIVMFGNAVLASKFKTALAEGLKVGAPIVIERIEDEPTGKGNDLKMYKLLYAKI